VAAVCVLSLLWPSAPALGQSASGMAGKAVGADAEVVESTVAQPIATREELINAVESGSVLDLCARDEYWRGRPALGVLRGYRAADARAAVAAGRRRCRFRPTVFSKRNWSATFKIDWLPPPIRRRSSSQAAPTSGAKWSGAPSRGR
jgi:hypothetical protein